MKALILLASLGLLVATQLPVEALAAPKKPAASGAKNKGKTGKQANAKGKVKANKYSTAKLQTDVRFDDSVVRGQYQAPEEALAKVENEKGLQNLLGVRKHFKDRLSQAAEQE